MLLLPYRDKSVLGGFPWVTVLLAAACVAVYLGPQAGDGARDALAYAYYHDSGLDGIELPRYQAYLAARTDGASAERLHLLHADADDPLAAAQLLQSDHRFLAALHGGQGRPSAIVASDDPVYSRWSGARAQFDSLVGASFESRFGLDRSHAAQYWRFLTYAFLHQGSGALTVNVLILLLLGPFVEAALGRLRFAFAYLGGVAAAGGLHVLLADVHVVGALGALAALAGMLAALYGARQIRVYYGIFAALGTLAFAPLFMDAVWLANEVNRWLASSRLPLSEAPSVFGAHAAALCAGALIAWLLRPAPRTAASRSLTDPPLRVEAGSSLVAQAQDAAARLDIRRATRLYRELVELEPSHVEHLSAYLNVALLGADEEALQDAALRLLWNKLRTPTDDLRRTFLQLTQPKVLKALPIDEHLRLARRLVRFREDSAALRVIDDLLRDDHLRELYGRQLVDCLLGLFTAYTRHGLQRQAEQINTRLSTYFPSAERIGGIAPASRPPSTIFSSLRTTVGGITLTPPEPGILPTNPAAGPDKGSAR
jgi:membrane associated rhomboid family serine protease